MSRPVVYLEKQVTDTFGIDFGIYFLGIRLDASHYLSNARYNVVSAEGQLLSKQPSMDRAREWAEDNGYVLSTEEDAWSYEEG